jgi:hypothetical protein
MGSETGWYVYGVVPAREASSDLFAGTGGVHASAAVELVPDDELAAIASTVPLNEFGDAAMEQNLRDAAWLEHKVRAHEAVLEAALGRTPLVPFRFGTIFSSREHVEEMLRENRDLTATLNRLRGSFELGVKGFFDPLRFEARAGEEQAEDAPTSGRAYLLRKQRDRRLGEARESFKASCAREAHARLSASARDARANPLQRPEVTGRKAEMFLNGAYLVLPESEPGFRETLAELQSTYGPDGVEYELTGPWPPYNFVEPEDAGE